jgi:putative endonuclease
LAQARRTLGKLGEAAALAYLQAQGYTLLQRNWRCRYGELDLVMQQASEVVFVEVRTRRSPTTSAPEESLTATKQARLITLAQHYLAAQVQATSELDVPTAEPPAWRIDVIVLEVNRNGEITRLEHLCHAIEG